MIMMARLGSELGGDAAVGRVRDARPARSCLVGAFKANPLRDICAALELPDLSLRRALRQPRAAVQAQGRAARACSASASRSNTREHWLARLEEQDLLCAPVRDMREALVDPQTAAQRDDHGRPRRRRPALRFIASPIADVGRAGRRWTALPPRLGEHTDEVLAEAPAGLAKRPAHERPATRFATTSPRSRSTGPRCSTRSTSPPRPNCSASGRDLEQRNGRSRGGADGRRRACLLRRRRHEEPVDQAASSTGPRRGPAASAASRCARAQPAGHRPRQRLRAGRRLRDGAGLRHRRRLRRRPASACPSRWSGACRWTAA